jgi:hypothetical protein
MPRREEGWPREVRVRPEEGDAIVIGSLRAVPGRDGSRPLGRTPRSFYDTPFMLRTNLRSFYLFPEAQSVFSEAAASLED